MLRRDAAGAAAGYGKHVPLAWIVLLAAVLAIGGCAHAPERPSTLAERTPTPGSVTRDNPAGDAEAQVDAALTRLLNEPDAFKRDRFRTLKSRLPDHKTWRRVRFWGHPTRAAWRYGKEGYAVAVLAYFDAEGDDSPRTCLERFAREAQETAESFDVAIGPRRRELHSHYKGPESVDWVEHERLAKKRRAERQQRLAEARRKALARRAKRKLWRQKRRLALQRKAGAKGPQPPLPKVVSQPAPDAQGKARVLGPPPGTAPRAPGSGLPLPAGSGSATPAAPPDGSAATTPPAPSAQPAGSATPAATGSASAGATQPSAKRSRRLVMRFPKLRALAKEARDKARKARAARRRAKPRRYDPEQHWRWRERRFGKADMPVIRVSGQFDTVLVQDRYVAAVVAYESWPDTCLVQGFAVKIGSDESLAAQVVDRWVEDLAGKLVWFHNLREAPPFENR